ncbi:cation transporter [Marichromatium purpuratum 984]|uniref:Cation transporter n=1 Tax=Marichromatium purpuratum 984 TaxID=765910 RepID=W0E682_MARPU|nr:Na+/H+ antiporter subunit E [Marichromatium purpuratum]AHF05063.1 cation transporter [Marichromatium purpuratum 984]
MHRRWTAAAILARGALFSLLWLILAGTDPQSWLIGLPSVALATDVSLTLSPPARRPRTLALLAFIPYFIAQSLRGGFDVALRVLAPRPRVAPGFIDYHTRLADPAARVLFLDTVSLLPGTLGADMHGQRLRVHAIDTGIDVRPELVALEQRIAALFAREGHG